MSQPHVDAFYRDNGPCCAGCDWWRWHNSLVGDCIRSAPVSGTERAAGLGMLGVSMTVPAGHVLTTRDHYCGEFCDSAALMPQEPTDD